MYQASESETRTIQPDSVMYFQICLYKLWRTILMKVGPSRVCVCVYMCVV